VHAVTHISGTQRLWYDANGNTITRTVTGVTQTLAWDAENRLISISAGGVITTYTYDGDGNRVKVAWGGSATAYVGNLYEVAIGSGAATSYYYLNGQRVAMRNASGVTYLAVDHLGSASLGMGTSNTSQRYAPYGATRSGSVPTDYQFTGQKNDGGTGLYYYRARYYDPVTGRFVSADTIVPSPGNPQVLNRYAYAYNNPIRYNDPSGHCPACLLVGFAAVRLAAELGVYLSPTGDQAMRDRIGGANVLALDQTIRAEAVARDLPADLIGAVVRHESPAVERRIFTLSPGDSPGQVADLAEAVEANVRGNAASIGIGQMQVGTATRLETRGYVPPRVGTSDRIAALLDPKTAVSYVGGELRHIRDKLSENPDFGKQTQETQDRVTLMGYNWGWSGIQTLAAQSDYAQILTLNSYHHQTYDEYRRWRAEQ
jgi:RHS repeat-associated protein